MPDDKILSVDIGGSHIKATVLNIEGRLQIDYKSVETPAGITPEKLIATIKELVKDFPKYEKVSVGFPGYIKNGVIITAPNLNPKTLPGFSLCNTLEKELSYPVKVVNDADMQGLGIVKGNGFEIVVTLGTGFGTALLFNGSLLPHIELAHHPFTKNKTYDKYIGEKALEREGEKEWNKRIKKVLAVLKTVFNYDYLYIGGGNSDKINFKLDKNITIFSNKEGIKGGARLWINKPLNA